jgi:hypothetical protein
MNHCHGDLYVEFKTWAQGPVDMPWPWAVYESLPDWRLVSDLTVAATAESVRRVFLSLDQRQVTEFLQRHVSAVVVGVILPADSAVNCQHQLQRVFHHVELLGSCVVTAENSAAITAAMAAAQRCGV